MIKYSQIRRILPPPTGIHGELDCDFDFDLLVARTIVDCVRLSRRSDLL